MVKRFGLFGFPLTHSFSQKYFSEKFLREKILDCVYENFERKNAEDLIQLVSERNDLIGLNVTIPHKENVLPFINVLEDEARDIGAVNCIRVFRSQNSFKLLGYNTDAYGFEQSITPFLLPHHQRALILGTGGASKAVAYTFRKLGVEYSLVSRNSSHGHFVYSDLTESTMKNFQIIINCTPFGMHPDVNSFPPIPYQYLSDKNLLFDLVYNPSETQFMKKGKVQGALVQNGLEMLKSQAEKSWEIWNGK
jgi:shikimate dehydrogenase